MKKWCSLLVVGLLLGFMGTAAGADFVLQSPQLEPGGRMAMEQVYKGFGCKGENVSPALHWLNPPQNTKSFAVTAYDPDAPTGSGWWHWVIFNIGADVDSLPVDAGNPASGKAPAGSVQTRSDYGTFGYGGACPPAGDKPHHYIFTVFALDVDKLPLEKTATAAMVGFYLHGHTIAKTSLTVYYSR